MVYDIQSSVAQCNGCGAPLPMKPSFQHPVKCDYCDLTNYLKKSAPFGDETQSIDEEAEAERYYTIYQESQKILENFPGELVGEEVGKVRIKMQVGAYAFPLLIVLDDLPDRPYIDGPSKLREILDCELTDLPSMKNWSPGSSNVLNVLEEIYKLAETSFAKRQEDKEDTTLSKTSTQKEKDPLFKKIIANYDAESTKKEIIIRFYTQNGEIINLIIKRKKNYPIGLESEVLNKFPILRGPLEDYAKGRIDLMETLSEIERLIYI